MNYAEGPLSAKIALVGEAPGVDEEITGRPFVGRAGHLLDQILAKVGIARTEIYITNVVKERPHNNDITKFISFATKQVTRTPNYEAYEKKLFEELDQTEVNVIVPLGNVPLYALTRQTAITKRRGSIYEWHGRKVIPTIHPAAALRDYLSTWLIQFDFLRIKEEAEKRERLFTYALGRKLLLNESFESIISILQEINIANQPIAFDIEVINGQVSHFSLATHPVYSICVPLFSNGSNVWTDEEEALIISALRCVLENPNVLKIGQNLAFDTSFMFQRYGIITRPVADTMICCNIVYPDFPKGLDFITSLYTKERYYKDEGKIWKNIEKFADGGEDAEMRFRRYSALDSAVCIEAYPLLLLDVNRCGNTETVVRQTQLIEPLVYMANKGILTDVERMRSSSFKLNIETEEYLKELYKLAGRPYNSIEKNTFHNSPKQLCNYFYIERGHAPYRDKGHISVGERALKQLARKGVKEAQLLIKIRHNLKLKTTYLDAKVDRDNRLRCSYNPVGTNQGRISSSKTIFGTGMNLQNQPPYMKRCMMADPGFILIQFDMAQAENRTVAYISNEVRMIQAFEKKADIHKLTASLIFGKSVEQISSEKGSSTIGYGDQSERDWGKRANHGLNYGLGYKQFALIYEIPEKDAKRIVDGYHRAYPSLHRWHNNIKDQLGSNRTLVNCSPFNRHRTFRDRLGDELFKQAYSFIPQSTIADLVNSWGTCFTYYTLMEQFPIELLLTVHDSVAFQAPLALGAQAIARCCTLLRESLEQRISYENRTFMIPADMQVGFNFGKFYKRNNKEDKKEENLNGLREVSRDVVLSAEKLIAFLSELV